MDRQARPGGEGPFLTAPVPGEDLLDAPEAVEPVDVEQILVDYGGLLGLVEAALAGNYDGPMPAEWHDWQLIKATGWTWQQLLDAPMYVRAAFTGFLYLEHAAERRTTEEAQLRSDPAVTAQRRDTAEALRRRLAEQRGLTPEN